VHERLTGEQPMSRVWDERIDQRSAELKQLKISPVTSASKCTGAKRHL